MKTICIDARMWGIKHTGIGRYIENLIDNLPEDSDVKIELIVSADGERELKLQKFTTHLAYFHPYSNLAQFEMLWILIKIRPNLLHVPHFTVPVLWPGRIVVTIHDLIKHMSRGKDTTTRHPVLYWLKYFQYLLLMWITVKKAIHIIVPAYFWKDILAKNYNLNPKKITVTYEAVSQLFLKSVAQKHPLASKVGPYIIYTGNVYPHKNIPILLAALAKIPRLKLVVVCARSIFESRLQRLIDKQNLQTRVIFKNSITDEELIQLLSGAVAFVTPSLIEGFGLPGLEAMAVGVPVLAADASCLPEIYADAALFFDPFKVDDLVTKLNLISQDKKLRTELVRKGKLQVNKYSWSKMAQQTWQIYRHALQ